MIFLKQRLVMEPFTPRNIKSLLSEIANMSKVRLRWALSQKGYAVATAATSDATQVRQKSIQAQGNLKSLRNLLLWVNLWQIR